jgi:hypothetical protein
MESAEDFEEAADSLDTEDNTRNIRPTGPSSQWLKTRRLIEEARETRELNKSLADFEDYVV